MTTNSNVSQFISRSTVHYKNILLIIRQFFKLIELSGNFDSTMCVIFTRRKKTMSGENRRHYGRKTCKISIDILQSQIQYKSIST